MNHPDTSPRHLQRDDPFNRDWKLVRRMTPTSYRFDGDVYSLTPFQWPASQWIRLTEDLFHETIFDVNLDSAFGLMAACSQIEGNGGQHIFQIATKSAKSAERMRDYLAVDRRSQWGDWAERHLGQPGSPHRDKAQHIRRMVESGPRELPKVWLGISIHTEADLADGLPFLREARAALRWLCFEPSIEEHPRSFDFSILYDEDTLRDIDWVVYSKGQSNMENPVDPTPINDLVPACKRAGVPFFFEGWAQWIGKNSDMLHLLVHQVPPSPGDPPPTERSRWALP